MKDIKQLLKYLKPYTGLVSLNILSNILMAVFTVVSIPAIIPFFQILFNLEPAVVEKPEFALSTSGVLDTIKYYFTKLIEDHDPKTALIYVCAVIVVLFFLKNLFRYLSLFFMAPVRNGIVRDIRQSLFEKLLALPLGYYTDERKGDLLSRTSSDITEIEFSILSMIQTLVREPIVILGSLLFMIYVSPTLTFFVFGLILFTVFIIGGISRTLKKKSREAQTQLGLLISQVEEMINGLRIIKTFNAENYQQERFRSGNNIYKNLLNRILWRRDLSSPLSEFLGIVVVAILMWYGSTQVFIERIEPETFFAFLFAFYNVINPAKSFSTAYYNVQKGLAAMDRIQEVLQTDLAIEESDHAIHISAFQNKIEFDEVSFSYSPQLKPVLQDINFVLPVGRTIALVGASGAGKSTLADLIPRLYDVSSGQILLDGRPIKEYTLKSLRSLIGFVSQEAILFNDTIFNNITFGNSNIEPGQVKQAARMAFAHEFILETPDQYDTIIGDKGVKLSGGQRQRLTIARAILKNPPILILDEATSALDAESEKWVKKALRKLMKARTVIVIAHRLSTVQHADEILVLKDGKIIERGTHSHLLEQKGEYLKFVELQSV